MIKKIILILFCSLSIYNVYSQKETINEYAQIDKVATLMPDSLTETTQGIANYIKSNFSNDHDQVRAVFAWIAYNIEYNVENMYVIDINENKYDKIAKILRTKKGICEDYTLLFNEICSLIGIRSYIVDGYTKQNNIIENTPHSWCVAQINKEWYAFDPTWGTGEVQNNKFIRKLNNSYFKAPPSYMIKSHMPFDFLWELLEYPINTEGFYANNIEQSDPKFYFNYIDSINSYDLQSENDRLTSAVNRIERNGIRNSSTAEYLKTLKINIENNIRTTISSQFNSAASDYNEGIKYLNDFVNYRNNKFKPSKSDSEIRDMMDRILNKFNIAKSQLAKIQSNDKNINNQIIELLESIDRSIEFTNEQDSWLTIYLKKGKLARKSMFYKVSWFGVPLN